MNKWYLYIDDCRAIDSKFYEYVCNTYGNCTPIVCRDYASTIQCLKEILEMRDEVIIDLDHDLGERKSGYDICKFIVENEYPLLNFHIHSMNIVGVYNMCQLLSHYGYHQL